MKGVGPSADYSCTEKLQFLSRSYQSVLRVPLVYSQSEADIFRGSTPGVQAFGPCIPSRRTAVPLRIEGQLSQEAEALWRVPLRINLVPKIFPTQTQLHEADSDQS